MMLYFGIETIEMIVVYDTVDIFGGGGVLRDFGGPPGGKGPRQNILVHVNAR